jgi:hypothetical protein
MIPDKAFTFIKVAHQGWCGTRKTRRQGQINATNDNNMT